MDAGTFLDELARAIESRKGADPGESYVASLLRGGEDRALKKLVEEAGELALACKGGDRRRITAEAADLLFHMLVALSRYGLGHEDVLAALRERRGISGHDEKRSRGSGEPPDPQGA